MSRDGRGMDESTSSGLMVDESHTIAQTGRTRPFARPARKVENRREKLRIVDFLKSRFSGLADTIQQTDSRQTSWLR